MAYSELIKNFNRIREYMQEFYVYGFKSREEYTRRSARSYDDERRRLESWLGRYMHFRQTREGKQVFISIDSRVSRHNPLYTAWKTSSFTDGDITLHFMIADILHDTETALTLKEITDAVDSRLAAFRNPKVFDASTIRKKMQEYTEEGLIRAEKSGKTVTYRRAEDVPEPDRDMLDFFSEVSPCGVIGSFLLDRAGHHESHFAFKHHYITGAMDSEIVCAVFEAMSEKRQVVLEAAGRRGHVREIHVVPLRVMISTQSGRQHLMAYVPGERRMISFRMDRIRSVRAGEVCKKADDLRHTLDAMEPHLWGVSTQGRSGERMEHVEFTVQYAGDETFIHRRLEREKRCGRVTRVDAHTSRFEADVYDAGELMPWIRTFICRITHFSCSDKLLEAQLQLDLREMYEMYGLNENNEFGNNEYGDNEYRNKETEAAEGGVHA